MNIRKSVLVLGLALAAAPASVFAAADNYSIHGASCVSITPGYTASVSQFGVNATGTPIDVVCPIIIPQKNYTNAYIAVYGYNRSSIDNVSCKISGTDVNGNNLASGTATLTGYGSAAKVGSRNVPLSTATFNNELYLTCHLPAATGLGASHLSHIWLQVTY